MLSFIPFTICQPNLPGDDDFAQSFKNASCKITLHNISNILHWELEEARTTMKVFEKLVTERNFETWISKINIFNVILLMNRSLTSEKSS